MSSGLRVGDSPTLTPPSPTTTKTSTRPRKVSKWDRPAPPKDWRYFVGGFGKILIALGLLTFGFVGYQLWGTGLETAAAQDELSNNFEAAVQANIENPPTLPPSAEDDFPTLEPADPEIEQIVTERDQAALKVPPDQGIMQMSIPKIDIKNYNVLAGVGREDLKQGVGHFPSTPWAGQLGNASFAGHRTTYGGPFFHLDKLEPGDRIIVTRIDGKTYSYEVTSTEVVTPDQVSVLSGNPLEATILLQTCTPLHSASHRLIIHGKLVPSESDVVGEPTYYHDPNEALTADTTVPPAPQTTTAPTQAANSPTTAAGNEEFVPRTTAPAATTPPTEPAPASTILESEGLNDEASGVIDEESLDNSWDAGWFEDRDAIPLVAMWGAALIAIYVVSRLIARWTRHDSIGIIVAAAPFLYCLYFFYQNVNRLLPAGI